MKFTIMTITFNIGVFRFRFIFFVRFNFVFFILLTQFTPTSNYCYTFDAITTAIQKLELNEGFKTIKKIANLVNGRILFKLLFF